MILKTSVYFRQDLWFIFDCNPTKMHYSNFYLTHKVLEIMMHSRQICNKNRSLMLHRLCTKIFKVITCPFLHARIEKWLTNIFDIKVKNDGINLEHIRIFLPATYSTFRLINSQYTMLQKYIDLIFMMLSEMNGTTSDTGMSENLGHTSDTRVRSSLNSRTVFNHSINPILGNGWI